MPQFISTQERGLSVEEMRLWYMEAAKELPPPPLTMATALI